MIYFIRDKASRAVKIGTADDPDKRLRQLQCGNPNRLKMVGVITGGKREEGLLHHFLEGHRIRGEWFSWDRFVSKMIADLFENGDEGSRIRVCVPSSRIDSHGRIRPHYKSFETCTVLNFDWAIRNAQLEGGGIRPDVDQLIKLLRKKHGDEVARTLQFRLGLDETEATP